MTNSKHIRDLYPEIALHGETAPGGEIALRVALAILMVIAFLAFGAGVIWAAIWVMQNHPLYFLLFAAAAISAALIGFVVKFALAVLAVFSGGR